MLLSNNVCCLPYMYFMVNYSTDIHLDNSHTGSKHGEIETMLWELVYSIPYMPTSCTISNIMGIKFLECRDMESVLV